MEDGIPTNVIVYVSIAWVVILLGVVGYAMNLWKLFTRERQKANVMAIRVVGIFIPAIGAIVGWF